MDTILAIFTALMCLFVIAFPVCVTFLLICLLLKSNKKMDKDIELKQAQIDYYNSCKDDTL